RGARRLRGVYLGLSRVSQGPRPGKGLLLRLNLRLQLRTGAVEHGRLLPGSLGLRWEHGLQPQAHRDADAEGRALQDRGEVAGVRTPGRGRDADRRGPGRQFSRQAGEGPGDGDVCASAELRVVPAQVLPTLDLVGRAGADLVAAEAGVVDRFLQDDGPGGRLGGAGAVRVQRLLWGEREP